MLQSVGVQVDEVVQLALGACQPGVETATQGGDPPRRGQLRRRVPPEAVLVDRVRAQQADPVVVPQRLGCQPAAAPERAHAQVLVLGSGGHGGDATRLPRGNRKRVAAETVAGPCWDGSVVDYRLVRDGRPPVGAPVLDAAQRQVVEHPGGPLLVLAGPGHRQDHHAGRGGRGPRRGPGCRSSRS